MKFKQTIITMLKNMKKSRRFSSFMLVGFVLILAEAIMILGGFKIGYNISPSMPEGVYFFKKFNSETMSLHKGDIVTFCVSDMITKMIRDRDYISGNTQTSYCKNNNPAFVKQVIALQNDKIEIDNDFLYINSVLLPKAQLFYTDIKGNPLPRLPNGYSKILNDKDVFVFGTGDIRSIDSRYLGIINKNNIAYTGKLLVRFN